MGVRDCAAAEAATELDELDRGVVHALQIHPRAPWTLVGEVLGVNPVTAARRWHRLEDAGLTWVTAYPRLSNSRIVVTGVVEVDTEPGVAQDVAQALAADPSVANIKLTAGGRDLVAAVRARSLDELARITTMRRKPQPPLASRLSLRCDLPKPLSGWPLSAVYFASVPGRHVEETSKVLAGVREVRSCAITAGPHNLVIDVWLRDRFRRAGPPEQQKRRARRQAAPRKLSRT